MDGDNRRTRMQSAKFLRRINDLPDPNNARAVLNFL